VLPNFSGTVTVALLNNPGGATLGGAVSVPAQSGVATFTGLTLDKAGSGYALLVTASSLASVETSPFNVILPPTVLSVQRHGVHYHPTTIVAMFSSPMDAASADDLANYQLVSAGSDHRFGARDDHVIRIRSVQYDVAADTVTILPAHRLPLRRRFQLTILGTPPAGLKATARLFLDGAGTGQEGTNYVIIINGKLLVPPNRYKSGTQSAAALGHSNR